VIFLLQRGRDLLAAEGKTVDMLLMFQIFDGANEDLA
jgi:hypothetical protein